MMERNAMLVKDTIIVGLALTSQSASVTEVTNVCLEASSIVAVPERNIYEPEPALELGK